MPATNVVTLLPAATEIVYALGAEPVAVSHECTYPPEAADKPRANTCIVDADGTSAAINEAVAGEDPLYELDRATLRTVDPDLIITQGVCEVCAIDNQRVRETVADMGLEAEVLATHPHTLDDVLADVVRIGAAIGHADRAEALVGRLRERIDRVATRAGPDRPRTLVLDWMEPPMVAGHWVPELVEIAGGTYGLTDPGAYSGPENFGDIVAFDPAVLVVAPCGFDREHTVRDIDELRDRPGWTDLRAVKDEAVYVMDGDVLNCPSPRLVDALETLGQLLHPATFDATPEPYEAVPVHPAP